MNRKYLKENLTRHLLTAGLILELWTVALHPQWMQMKAPVFSSLRRDFIALEASMGRYTETGEYV